MSGAVRSLFSFYYESTILSVIGLPLPAQLRGLSGFKIILLDYCGMVYKYIKAFRSADARIFLMDGVAEDARASADGYDVVYAMVHEMQSTHINFECILVVFRKNSIVRIVYQR